MPPSPDNIGPSGESARGVEKTRGADRLDARDVASLLRLMGQLAAWRTEPRRWRAELLGALIRLLPATAAAACVVTLQPGAELPQVVGLFDAGFKIASRRQAFLNEFHQAPLQDPVSRQLLLEAAGSTGPATLTALRRDRVDETTWYASANVQEFRREALIDDCVISVHRPRSRELPPPGELTLMVLMAFRGWDDPARFSGRERILLNTLHAGMAWIYHAEESAGRVTQASALSPRLRQTLELLLAGNSERQVALRIAISIHTVHDYVKALYLHFGVSSRGALMARWVQSGGALPAPQKDK